MKAVALFLVMVAGIGVSIAQADPDPWAEVPDDPNLLAQNPVAVVGFRTVCENQNPLPCREFHYRRVGQQWVDTWTRCSDPGAGWIYLGVLQPDTIEVMSYGCRIGNYDYPTYYEKFYIDQSLNGQVFKCVVCRCPYLHCTGCNRPTEPGGEQ